MTDVRPAEHANELSKIDKTRFCVAFFVFSFAWMLALQIVAAVLLPQRLADIAPDSKRRHFRRAEFGHGIGFADFQPRGWQHV